MSFKELEHLDLETKERIAKNIRLASKVVRQALAPDVRPINVPKGATLVLLPQDDPALAHANRSAAQQTERKRRRVAPLVVNLEGAPVLSSISSIALLTILRPLTAAFNGVVHSLLAAFHQIGRD